MSIGEVLALLQSEFPDVTISKIRFLESQGLIDPERTPSGYRKFYPADIERLRWILREQRENFLPLKVIKDRLDSGEPLDSDEVTQAVAVTAPADGEVDLEEPPPSWLPKPPRPGPPAPPPARPDTP
ncbi:MAG: MerR family transcriptional regulator, partial [Actinobacteria bacterium]